MRPRRGGAPALVWLGVLALCLGSRAADKPGIVDGDPDDLDVEVVPFNKWQSTQIPELRSGGRRASRFLHTSRSHRDTSMGLGSVHQQDTQSDVDDDEWTFPEHEDTLTDATVADLPWQSTGRLQRDETLPLSVSMLRSKTLMPRPPSSTDDSELTDVDEEKTAFKERRPRSRRAPSLNVLRSRFRSLDAMMDDYDADSDEKPRATRNPAPRDPIEDDDSDWSGMDGDHEMEVSKYYEVGNDFDDASTIAAKTSRRLRASRRAARRALAKSFDDADKASTNDDRSTQVRKRSSRARQNLMASMKAYHAAKDLLGWQVNSLVMNANQVTEFLEVVKKPTAGDVVLFARQLLMNGNLEDQCLLDENGTDGSCILRVTEDGKMKVRVFRISDLMRPGNVKWNDVALPVQFHRYYKSFLTARPYYLNGAHYGKDEFSDWRSALGAVDEQPLEETPIKPRPFYQVLGRPSWLAKPSKFVGIYVYRQVMSQVVSQLLGAEFNLRMFLVYTRSKFGFSSDLSDEDFRPRLFQEVIIHLTIILSSMNYINLHRNRSGPSTTPLYLRDTSARRYVDVTNSWRRGQLITLKGLMEVSTSKKFTSTSAVDALIRSHAKPPRIKQRARSNEVREREDADQYGNMMSDDEMDVEDAYSEDEGMQVHPMPSSHSDGGLETHLRSSKMTTLGLRPTPLDLKEEPGDDADEEKDDLGESRRRAIRASIKLFDKKVRLFERKVYDRKFAQRKVRQSVMAEKLGARPFVDEAWTDTYDDDELEPSNHSPIRMVWHISSWNSGVEVHFRRARQLRDIMFYPGTVFKIDNVMKSDFQRGNRGGHTGYTSGVSSSGNYIFHFFVHEVMPNGDEYQTPDYCKKALEHRLLMTNPADICYLKGAASDGPRSAPHAPDGEAPQAPDGEAPQAPDGEAPQAPEAPDGEPAWSTESDQESDPMEGTDGGGGEGTPSDQLDVVFQMAGTELARRDEEADKRMSPELADPDAPYDMSPVEEFDYDSRDGADEGDGADGSGTPPDEGPGATTEERREVNPIWSVRSGPSDLMDAPHDHPMPPFGYVEESDRADG